MSLNKSIMFAFALLIAFASPSLAAPNHKPLAETHSAPLPIVLEGSAPYYVPQVAVVPVGAGITWVNPTPSPHSIRHDGCLNFGACAFDSGAVKPDGTFSIHLLSPGTYHYHCELHPVMRGTVVVVDSPPKGQGNLASAVQEIR